MKFTNPFVAGVLSTLILIGGYWLLTSGKVTTEAEFSVGKSDGATATRNCFVKTPDEVVFAGTNVPLDDPEVFERLDRELHVNTFFHSSTINNIKMANRYFPVIEPILEVYDIPEDFKYIAVAESGLRNVISPMGAEGPWQIMKKTAIEYGLEVNDEVDERYEVAKATHVAAQYLRDAYQKYDDWILAAASYNMGKAALSRDMDQQEVDNYFDLFLNQETSRYIFRLVALKLIMEQPDEYHFCFDQDDLYDPIPVKPVEVTSTIDDLNDFAKEQGTTLKMIKYLNPWLRKRELTVKEGQKYIIQIPA